MSLRHKFDVTAYAAQLEAIGAGETRVLILETASGRIQKGDVLDFGPEAGHLPFGPAPEYQVARIVPGTKGNGVLPGFAIVEVIVPASQMIEGPPARKRNG